MEPLIIFTGVLTISLFLILVPYTKIADKFLFMISLSIILSVCIIILPLKIDLFYGYLLFIFTLLITLFHKDNIKSAYVSNQKGFLSIIFSEKYAYLFPIIGLFIFFLPFFIHLIKPNNGFGSTDTLLMLQGLAWMSYNFIGMNFTKEKDFIFLFINFLSTLFFVFSLTTFIFSGEGDSYNWSFAIHFLLAKPLAIILNLLGFFTLVEMDSIWYQDKVTGVTTRLWIAKSCSGINSVIIFISAYSSYLLSDPNKPRELCFLIFLGIIFSYFANLFRMTIIVIVGHYYGIDYLLWTHENIGWLIFTIWLVFFWRISDFVERYISGVRRV